MKLSINFAVILGLSMILIPNRINGAELSEQDEKNWIEKINSLGAKKNQTFTAAQEMELFKLGTKLASSNIPAPIGPVIGSVSTAVVSYLDAKKKINESLTLQSVNKKLEDLQKSLAVESQRVINHMTFVINAHPFMTRLEDEVNYFKRKYTEDFIGCLLAPQCHMESKKKFKKTLLDPTSEFKLKLNSLVSKFVSTGKSTGFLRQRKGVFNYAVEKQDILQTSDLDCYNQSEKSQIIELFKYIMAVVVKSYSMVTTAQLMRYREELSVNNTEDSEASLHETVETIRRFHSDVTSIIDETEKSLSLSSRDIRACEPKEYKRGVSYERLTHFIQTYVGNGCSKGEPSNRFGQLYSRHCKQIKFFAVTAFYNETDYERIYESFTLSLDNGFGPGSFEEYGSSEKKGLKLQRYDSLENNKCPSSECIGCLCKIDFHNKNRSVRSLNLDYVGTSPGYAVTGIKWTIKNRIIYLEIQEGKLIDSLTVDNTTVRWKTTPENPNNVLYLSLDDVFGFVLDDVSLPSGSLLTGVQFFSKNRLAGIRVYGDFPSEGSGLNDEKLLINNRRFPQIIEPGIGESRWSSKGELQLDEPDRSELGKDYKMYREPGQHHVMFQPSDLKKDAGQTTVPYLDIQEVVTWPSSPVSGLGVYHKGKKGYGGFLGLKLLSMDFDKIINKDKIGKYGKIMNQILARIDPSNMTSIYDL